MHVPRTDLDDVHICKQIQRGDVHDFGDDGQTGLSSGLQQQLDAFALHALESIGRGTGLECAAAKNVGTGGLHSLCHGNNLLLGFHGAGAGHHGEVATADFYIAHLDDGIGRVELPVSLLEGLGNTLDGFDNFQAVQQFHIHATGVANQAQDGHLSTLRDMDIQIHASQPVNQVVCLFGGSSVFQDSNHDNTSPNKNSAARYDPCGALGIHFVYPCLINCSTNRYYFLRKKK